MFNFVTTYLGFLKHIPFLPTIFDGLQRMLTWIRRPGVARCMDAVEKEVLEWEGVSISWHKFGGMQFDLGKREIGHMHGNGTVDIFFTTRLKEQLKEKGRVEEHHFLPNTGWASFYIKAQEDTKAVIELFRLNYDRLSLTN